jgi:osmoprotectant transport system permease protein
MPFLEFLAARRDQILACAGEHLVLVAASTSIAVALGLPIGVWLTRRPSIARFILGVANVVQTIPSLALFGFLIPLPFLGGIGARTAIVALVLYALLPILTNTYAGIRGVPAPIVEAATGMGMTPSQVLLRIELPLAAPVILAGVRIATVVSVGVATIAAAIGAGGLGTLIFRGVAMVDNRLVLAGAVPAALLAVAADLLLTWVERAIQPSRRRPRPALAAAAAEASPSGE